MTVNFWIGVNKLKNFRGLNVCQHLATRCAGAKNHPCKIVKHENTWKRWIYRDNVNLLKTQKECWHCHKLIGLQDFSCPFCSVMQHPSPGVTFFQIFNVGQKYDLDSEHVSKKFKELQKIFHPDKSANRLKEEIIISEYYSKLLNEAYATLRDPLRRGIYLLKLHGLSIDDDKNVNVDQDFLCEIMEKNEQLEKIQDSPSLKKEIVLNNEKQERALKDLSTAFRENDLPKARNLIVKLKYYDNIHQKLKEKKSAFGIVD